MVKKLDICTWIEQIAHSYRFCSFSDENVNSAKMSQSFHVFTWLPPKTWNNVILWQNKFLSDSLPKQFCSVTLKCVQLSKQYHNKRFHSTSSTLVQNTFEDICLVRILLTVWIDGKNIGMCIYLCMHECMYTFIHLETFFSLVLQGFSKLIVSAINVRNHWDNKTEFCLCCAITTIKYWFQFWNIANVYIVYLFEGNNKFINLLICQDKH